MPIDDKALVVCPFQDSHALIHDTPVTMTRFLNVFAIGVEDVANELVKIDPFGILLPRPLELF
jgi:hypothetical protein